jgi:transposase
MICIDYPSFQKIHDIVWKFRELFREKNLDKFDQWLKDASLLEVSEINSFINGMDRDIEAVRNAVLLNYSNGLAEGSVNKIKVIKRIMYGRCGFEMLRTKTLRLEKMRKIN